MKEKDYNLELLRVIAIFGTVGIHVSNLYINDFANITEFNFLISVFYNAIFRICVPLFFMISGSLLIGEEYNFKKYKNRVLKFILILAVWSIAYYLSKNYASLTLTGVIKDGIASLFSAYHTSRHLWYMYALIGLYIALPFISSMCKNLTRQQENLFLILWLNLSGLSAIYLPLSGLITQESIAIEYPIPLINSAYYLGYFICGHILYKRCKNIEITNKKRVFLVVGFAVSVLVMTAVTFFVSQYNDKYYNAMFWYKNILISLNAIFIFLLFITMPKGKVKDKINLLSKYTFGIYLVHIFALSFIRQFIPIVKLDAIYVIPVCTVLVYLISLLLTVVLKKIPIIKGLL